MGNLALDIARADVPATSFLISGKQVIKIASPLPMGDLNVYRVEIILWATDDGMLYAVEVISYGDGYIADPYRLFVEVAESQPEHLRYPTL